MERRGFTLSELLVVVVIIGVLSAVVLPKFSKVIETRKTTEAEELMSAVRNEQEARCTLSKNYTDQVKKLGSYRDGKNYSYALGTVGMAARAKSGKYKLEMPSYADGRICCSDIEIGACNNLSKNYPLCSDLTNKSKTPDYVEGNADCGVEPCEGDECNPEPEECTNKDEHAAGTTTTTDSEGCTVSTTWTFEDYPTCRWNKTETKSDCPKKCEPSERDLDECAHDYGHWDYNPDVCKCVPDCDMSKQENLNKAQNCEQGAQAPNWVAGTWNTNTCTCKCPDGSDLDEEGQCVQDLCPKTQENLDRAQNCERGAQAPNWVAGQWNWDGPHACDCDCPPGSRLDSSGQCVPQCSKDNQEILYKAQDCEQPQQTKIAVDGPGWEVYDVYPGKWNWDGPHACDCECGAWEWDNKHKLVLINGMCHLKCDETKTHDSPQSRDICRNGSSEDQAKGIAEPGYFSDYWCGCQCATNYGVKERKSGGEVVSCYRDNCSTAKAPAGGWETAKNTCELLPASKYYKCCGNTYIHDTGVPAYNNANCHAYYGTRGCDTGTLVKGKWNAEKCQCACPKGSKYKNGYCTVSTGGGSSVDYDNFYGDEGYDNFDDRDFDWDFYEDNDGGDYDGHDQGEWDPGYN